ncbi:MAG: hypothetical protein E6K60_03555 [Nitrospirae bacterium]|nr:MAG: hypothetical protein E6K60_03555 [Nitrospirota bacterium]
MKPHECRRLIGAWMLALVAIGAMGCSKPSGVLPSDAAQVRKIDEAVEQLRQSYIHKDPKAFHELLMPLDSLRRLELEIERDFAIYDRINVDFGIDRVLVEGSDAAVYFHWQGQWQRKTDDQPLRERGHAILHLVGHKDMVLSSVEGDSPFGISGRRLPTDRASQP